MTIILTKDNVHKILKPHFKLNWNGAHGISHWQRVRTNGKLLAREEGGNEKIAELFAWFHDSCRLNEYDDLDHGKRGADLAVKYRGELFDATDDELALLVDACTRHSDGHLEADITVQCCWDADRLDLGRVGIIPNRKRLCTATAKNNDFYDFAYFRSLKRGVDLGFYSDKRSDS
jgi:uncharacterized protein